MNSRRPPIFIMCLSLALAILYAAEAGAAQPPVVPERIDARQTVALEGNTRPEAVPENDRGAVAANLPLDHLQLLLKRSPETELALERFIDSQADPHSPNFHHWLSAADFGAEYGPADADMRAVTGWLTAHGFTVNGVSTGRTVIDFSGTAGAVRDAFQTEIHRLDVKGVSHIANFSDPRIPASLSGVVAGIVSLNDFRPHPMVKKRPAYTISGGFYAVVPADLATIYNFTPVFKAGISGQGQTVVVIEDTNIYKASDFTTFRSKFGLSSYTGGSLTQTHPSGSVSCGNPGVVSGNEGEAELDMEWASAAAPSATIEVASCADTETNFGGLIALENLIDSDSPPAVVSISYGECEAENGATANAAFNSVYQQAVALGTSVFVSAGDEGAASCDADLSNATHGIGVSGFASTQYNVAVGGTDFGDTYAGVNSKYWGSTNTATYGSAKSYIPEIPWNDSCASVFLSKFNGYTTPYGSGGFCNSSTGKADYLTTASGSGGPSGCFSGAPSISGVVSGTCKGYAKPSWQAIYGNPADKVRDMPDVSLFAANGVWGHYYIYCDTDVGDGESCSGAPSNWSGAGGTSFASPILAGIQALVNQNQGGAQGNPNPVYYKLAAAEFGSAGNTSCYSNQPNGNASSCVFHDVVYADMDVNCTGTYDCYKPSGTYGVLSTIDTADKPAYGTAKGWDFGTGIGSVDVANLVNNW